MLICINFYQLLQHTSITGGTKISTSRTIGGTRCPLYLDINVSIEEVSADNVNVEKDAEVVDADAENVAPNSIGDGTSLIQIKNPAGTYILSLTKGVLNSWILS